MLLPMNIHHFLFAFDGKHICWFLSRSSSVRPLNGLSAVPGKRDAERCSLISDKYVICIFFREMQSQQTCLSKTIGGSSFQRDGAKVGSVLFALWSWQPAVCVWNHLDNMIRMIKSRSFESLEFRRSGLSVCVQLLAHVCVVLLDLFLSIIIRCSHTEAPLTARRTSVVMLWWMRRVRKTAWRTELVGRVRDGGDCPPPRELLASMLMQV